MPRIPDPNMVEWGAVEVPFAAGVELTTPARAVAAPRLLRFENGRFDSARVGLRKRRGHVGYPIRTTVSLSSASLREGDPVPS